MTLGKKMAKKIDLWDSYNTLLMSSDTSRLQKILVRYELFKISSSVPGDIVECGVFKGAGWMYWLKLLHLYSHGEQKRVLGFDVFSNFATSLLDYEEKSAKDFTSEAEFEGVDPEDLLTEARMAGFSNGELIGGDVVETIPNYAAKNPGFRISLLNLDFDTYHGTKVALETFYEFLSPGAVVVFDEYGKRGWGESDAVDEFLKNKNEKLEAIRGSGQPTALFIKQ